MAALREITAQPVLERVLRVNLRNSKSNISASHPANLLKKFGIDGLTPAEEAELSHELSQAYHRDEAAASSRDVQRIAEKVRARLAASESAPKSPAP